MAAAFDERHDAFSRTAHKLLGQPGGVSDSAAQRQAMRACLYGLRSNRWMQQPLRLDTNIVSPRGIACEHGKPLALPSARGGPLVPVYERPFDTEVITEAPPVAVRGPWTLMDSVWGSRSENCDSVTTSHSPSLSRLSQPRKPCL